MKQRALKAALSLAVAGKAAAVETEPQADNVSLRSRAPVRVGRRRMLIRAGLCVPPIAVGSIPGAKVLSGHPMCSRLPLLTFAQSVALRRRAPQPGEGHLRSS
jgi:hypothetical protein